MGRWFAARRLLSPQHSLHAPLTAGHVGSEPGIPTGGPPRIKAASKIVAGHQDEIRSAWARHFGSSGPAGLN
jgi:hypothetical protein